MGGLGGQWGDPTTVVGHAGPDMAAGVLREGGHIVSSYRADIEYKGPELGSWAVSWSSRRMLLFMQHRWRHPARQTLEVWQEFQRLFLQKWEKDFIRRCLWKKLPVGTRMERLGGKLCPLDSNVETHEHVFRHCFFSSFLFDTVRRAFGLVPAPSRAMEPCRLLHEHPLLSLTMTQGLILWAGVKVQWNLRCRAKYQKQAPVFNELIAGWATVLRRWRSERDMSCARSDLHRFVGILDGWFENPNMPQLFKSKPKPPTNAQPPQQQDKLARKEAKWGGYRDAAIKRLASLEEDGWTVAYTDGSSKMVRGWRQRGYGVWFAESSTRNLAAPIPETERQSVSRGELRGVLHAILQRRPGELLIVVLDSEYVYKGIMEWLPKWQRHGWRAAGVEVGHRDLWEQILWERERVGDDLQVHLVPSHLGVHGNHKADVQAEEGRRMHPHNQQGLPKRPRVESMWADLGLEEMPSEVSSWDGETVQSSATSSADLSELEGGSGSELETNSCSCEGSGSTLGGSVFDTGSC